VGKRDAMKSRRERLLLLQMKQQHCYRAYLSGEMDKEEYLLAIYPIDCAIDRLELSFLYGRMNRLLKTKKKP